MVGVHPDIATDSDVKTWGKQIKPPRVPDTIGFSSPTVDCVRTWTLSGLLAKTQDRLMNETIRRLILRAF